MLNKKLHAQFCFFDPSYNMQLAQPPCSFANQHPLAILSRNQTTKRFLSTYAFNNLQYKKKKLNDTNKNSLKFGMKQINYST